MPEEIGTSDPRGATPAVSFDRFSGGGWDRASACVPNETALTVYVNRRELVTILCTPTKLNCLVLGFLWNEGIISSPADVASMRVCPEESLAEVMLRAAEVELPRPRTLTSGCGGGAIYAAPGEKIESGLVVPPQDVLSLMDQFQKKMGLYKSCGGVHTSALSDARSLIVAAEDLGRHNTLDKIQGECLLRGLPTADRLLLSTGRVSSEMLIKAAKMRVPIVVSRHSTTGSAVSLARRLGVTLVGHARGRRLSVYSHSERLGCASH